MMLCIRRRRVFVGTGTQMADGELGADPRSAGENWNAVNLARSSVPTGRLPR
jgi:hypothetical protein